MKTLNEIVAIYTARTKQMHDVFIRQSKLRHPVSSTDKAVADIFKWFRETKTGTQLRNLILPLAAVAIISCTVDPITSTSRDSAPPQALIPADIDAIPNAIPKFELRTRAGNPKTYKVFGQHYTVLKDSKNHKEKGIASWYGNKFHGRKTANGEIYDMFAMSAAHKTLPIPSYVRVTNLSNQRSIIVRINDRGPFHDGRIIDLSYAAAVKLGIQQAGTGLVEIETLEPDQPQKKQAHKNTSAGKNKGPIYLQIGAFSNEFNAQELIEKINAKNLPPTRIHSVVQQGSPVYKVQLGPLNSVSEAENMSELLAKKGFNPPLFIIDNKQQ
jgi:peptidoglycan lytic transglycosylase